MYKQGLKSIELECYEDALLAFDKIVKLPLKTYTSSIWVQRGIFLCALGRYEEALNSYDLALQYKFFSGYTRKFYSYIWLYRGNTLYELERYQEAIINFEYALKNNRNCLDSWIGKAFALKELGQYEEAITNFDRALKRQPDSYYAFYGKACCYALIGEVSLALKELQQTFRINPDEYREIVKNDSDLDSIRTDERFKQFLAELD
ncbi:MAG: tetratricopeptide repeat protein [Xenococcaceae cyanobacterium]